MNLRNSCTSLAAALSAKYATYQEFHGAGGGDLNSYLDHNGLLVSMCINFSLLTQRFYCDLRKHDRVLSTSWIQRNQTGFRVFRGASPQQLPVTVGMVIDPTAMEIQCLYPSDGLTGGRDDLVINGKTAQACGPVNTDPRFGSKGYDHLPRWKKILVRAAWNAYAQHNFGNNRSVSCRDFFFQPDDDGKEIMATPVYLKERRDDETACSDRDNPEFTFYDYIEFPVQDAEYMVQHKLCEPSSNTTKFHRNDWFLYAGRCSWRPDQFTDMLRTMQKLDREHPKVQNWNEIVFDRPKDNDLANAVQAVFFVEWPGMDDAVNQRAHYRNAVQQAQKLGKHLFKVHWKEERPLFTCNRSAAAIIDQDDDVVLSVEDE